MRVWRPRPPGGFEWVVPVDSDQFDILEFDGTPRAEQWSPVLMERVTVTEHGEELLESDFPWLFDGAYVFSVCGRSTILALGRGRGCARAR